MVGHFLRTGNVGAVVVGADRIAANGDTANKIGTYGIAVLARENNVPVLRRRADLHARSLARLRRIHPHRRAQRRTKSPTSPASTSPPTSTPRTPPSTSRRNKYITAIITERGVATAPFTESLRVPSSRSPLTRDARHSLAQKKGASSHTRASAPAHIHRTPPQPTNPLPAYPPSASY